MEKALEFFHFDFEFSDEPSDTSLKQNYDVRIHWHTITFFCNYLQLSLGFQVFQVDKQYPDMSTVLQNVANIWQMIFVQNDMANDICVKFLLEIFFSRKKDKFTKVK